MTIQNAVLQVLIGVLTGGIVGWVPFFFAWRWRLADRRDAALAVRREALAPVAQNVGGSLANIQMHLACGKFSALAIVKEGPRLLALVNSTALPAGEAARLRGLVDAYLQTGDYDADHELAVARAQAILAFCNG